MHTVNFSSTIHTSYVVKVSKLQKYVFQHSKVWERKFPYVFEKDDPKLPRKRKVSIHYEEEEAPVEFASKVEEYYHLFLSSN